MLWGPAKLPATAHPAKRGRQSAGKGGGLRFIDFYDVHNGLLKFGIDVIAITIVVLYALSWLRLPECPCGRTMVT